MKKSVYCIIIMLVITTACARQADKYPLGGWQLVQTQSIENGKMKVTYPGILVGNEYKMWSEKNFIFFGRWKTDSVTTDNYGYGTYTLNGKDYEETVMYHFMKEYEGQKIKMSMELINDTLIQIYHPVDSTGVQSESISSVEKWVRRK
jgi:hypothetical protein